MFLISCFFFFFKQKTAYEMRISDWSSDVCSSDLFALAWWLLAVAAGGDVYATAAACLASPIGMIALFGFSLSLVYHLLNGIRHMLLDICCCFHLPEVYRSGYSLAFLSVFLSALISFFALLVSACAIRRPCSEVLSSYLPSFFLFSY